MIIIVGCLKSKVSKKFGFIFCNIFFLGLRDLSFLGTYVSFLWKLCSRVVNCVVLDAIIVGSGCIVFYE